MKISIFAIIAFLLAPLNAQAAAENLSCRVGGCSGEICESALGEGMATTCEWSEEYACYKTAHCERQQDGKCGWTKTKEFEQCLMEKQNK